MRKGERVGEKDGEEGKDRGMERERQWEGRGSRDKRNKTEAQKRDRRIVCMHSHMLLVGGRPGHSARTGLSLLWSMAACHSDGLVLERPWLWLGASPLAEGKSC